MIRILSCPIGFHRFCALQGACGKAQPPGDGQPSIAKGRARVTGSMWRTRREFALLGAAADAQFDVPGPVRCVLRGTAAALRSLPTAPTGAVPHSLHRSRSEP